MPRTARFRYWDGVRYLTHMEYGPGLNVLELKDVEQFTGLKDINGVEIWEGDIVICYHWKEPHVIVLPDDYYVFIEYALHDCLIVVGNIHDKELSDANVQA